MAARERALAALFLALLAAITLWNARSYPPGDGYDAAQHSEYAESLIGEGRIPGPETRSEYYTPPLFYALAGAATEAGEAAGLGEPRKAAQALNALLALGTALLTLALARLLWPGRPVLWLGALGFLCLLPVLVKTTAMFHPEPLSLFLSTAALFLAARMVVRGAWSWPSAAALGVVLGAGQLVRAFALWTFAVVVLTLLAVALTASAGRRRALGALLVTVLATAAVAGPWYVRQATRYTNPVVHPHNEAAAVPLWERRPLAFYVDPGLPEIFTHPYRPAFTNLALAETYAELWGDWYGVFAWEAADRDPSAGVERQLALQHALGLVPTALGVVGWLGLLLALARSRLADPARLLVALLPLAGIAGYLYFTVSYPTPDGDVLKATYLLTTAPAWALAFGLALDRLAHRRSVRLALLALLAVSALVNLRFLVHGDPLGGLL